MDSEPIRARLERAGEDQALDLAAGFLGVPPLDALPRPGDVVGWRLGDWERAAEQLGFSADGRTKHSFLFRHRLMPVTFGLATTPGDERSWPNTCGDLRRRWRVLLLEAAQVLGGPAPGVSEDALRRRTLDDLARGVLADREAALEVKRARQAAAAREETLRKLMREADCSREAAEALAAAVLDERGGVPDPTAWAEASDEALKRVREGVRQEKEAARLAREAERSARASQQSERAEDRAAREAERAATEAQRAAERAKAAERAGLWTAIEERRASARRALNEADRQIQELVAARLDQAEAREARLRQILDGLRPLLAAGTPAALAEAQRLLDSAAPAPS
jgi:hypothetical protein